MLKYKAVIGIFLLAWILSATAFADELEDNWGNFLHYTKIGRLDLAKGYAQAVLDAEPNAVTMLGFMEKNPQAQVLLKKAAENEHDPQLAELAGKILAIIEQGRFVRRSEPAIIAEEIRRLSGTARGRLEAVKRLKNAGEYAIPFMIDAMSDSSRREELPNIVWALPQIGRDAIRPLTAALQTEDTAVRAEIVKALGEIGYPQSLGYLKYVVENDGSAQIRDMAAKSIEKIDPAAIVLPAAELLYRLGEDYYYHVDSLSPAEDANFGNIWFWDKEGRLVREEVDREYFYELMAMRNCEGALRADAGYGRAIGLWIASFFKAESAGLAMPKYFGAGHASASVYSTTAGPEYLHQALARAIKDKNGYVALQTIEALAANAGEKSLMYRLETEQPLLAALSFDDKAVRYSAAIAIAGAGPKETFAENKIVVENLAQALRENAESGGEPQGQWSGQLADSYALRAAQVILKLAVERNPVINLADAESALVDATKDSRVQIKLLAAQILAYLNSASAQRAIAAMALSDENLQEIRISAFGSLALSAKVNGSLLDDGQIGAIYAIVGSKDAEPALRSAAASAYGALNLPSQKVKDLILDQAKS